MQEFKNFDWGSIGAEVEKFDTFGVAVVLWEGKRFIRRSPENNFGVTIFFSRSIGKDAEGRNRYERLITFKPDTEVAPISRKAEGYLR